MSSPLTLRLCCLVAMAPALTSDLASTVRDKVSSSEGGQGQAPAPAAGTPEEGGAKKLLQHMKPIQDLSGLLCTMNKDSVGVNGDVKIKAPSNTSSSNNGISSLKMMQSPLSLSPVRTKVQFNVADVSINTLASETAKKQKILEGRQQRLLKRLRRLQSRQSISHVKQQMSGFVTTVQQNLAATRSQDFKNELLQGHDVKNLSTAALVNLVQKLQASQSVKKNARLEAEIAKDPIQLEEETCLEMDRVAGHLKSNLRHLERAIDSDATESSSGGESCDEMDLFDDDEWADRSSKLSVTKRAEWRWACDRSSIASRWTWLQAQVSDLEYRIRQQNDIFRQIRSNKGVVTLGNPDLPKIKVLNTEIPASKPSPNISTADVHSSKEFIPAQQLENVGSKSTAPQPQVTATTCSTSTPTLNGVSVVHTPSMNLLEEDDDSCVAARCRPVKSFRKRKLLKTAGVHLLSQKAAKLSTVHCQCYPLFTPCALCGGRVQHTTTLDANNMSVTERTALLDNSFHPVLSFPQDISLSLHFQNYLKKGDWQDKAPSKSLKTLQSEKRRARYNRDKAKKYAKRISKGGSAVIVSSTKIRNKYDQKPLIGGRSQSSASTPKHDRASNRRLSDCKNLKKKRSLHGSAPSTPASRDSNQSPLNASGSSLKDLKEIMRKRRGENAYDIDNIVIPYSIAASTRVEKLKYKEIETPKWRLLDGEEEEKCKEKDESATTAGSSGAVAETTVAMEKDDAQGETKIDLRLEDDDLANLPDEEDLADDAYARRHLQCEISEKKRFSVAASASRRSRSTNSMSLEDENEEGMRRNSSASSMKEIARIKSRSKSTESVEDPVNSWTPRVFPLDEPDYNDLHRTNISVVKCTRRTSETSSVPASTSKGDNLMSMASESEEEEVYNEQDDPEWTVGPVVAGKSAIVLKLAKK